MADVRVGISGWTYAAWRGNFYPTGLPRKLELAYASRRFNALEVNGTFYSLQRPETFRAWHGATPPGFVFAVRAGGTSRTCGGSRTFGGRWPTSARRGC